MLTHCYFYNGLSIKIGEIGCRYKKLL